MSQKNGKTKSEQKQGSGFFVKAINFLAINVAIGAALIGIKYAYKNLQPEVYRVVPRLQSLEWNQTTQVQILSTIAYFYALFLIGCVLLVSLGRLLLFKPNPVQQQDPLYIATMNRVLQNSVEQGLIFLPIYAYYLFNFATKTDKEFAILLGLQFVVGRVLFALGYLFIFIRLPTLRSLGFVLTFGASLIALFRTQGVDLLSYLDLIPVPV